MVNPVLRKEESSSKNVTWSPKKSWGVRWWLVVGMYFLLNMGGYSIEYLKILQPGCGTVVGLVISPSGGVQNGVGSADWMIVP